MRVSKRIYVSSGWDNRQAARGLMTRLRKAKHKITHDWTREKAASMATLKGQIKLATADLRGIEKADALIVLLPGKEGTHIELGYALALDLPVLIVGTVTRQCPFYALCERADSGAESLAWLAAL